MLLLSELGTPHIMGPQSIVLQVLHSFVRVAVHISNIQRHTLRVHKYEWFMIPLWLCMYPYTHIVTHSYLVWGSCTVRRKQSKWVGSMQYKSTPRISHNHVLDAEYVDDDCVDHLGNISMPLSTNVVKWN